MLFGYCNYARGSCDLKVVKIQDYVFVETVAMADDFVSAGESFRNNSITGFAAKESSF